MRTGVGGDGAQCRLSPPAGHQRQAAPEAVTRVGGYLRASKPRCSRRFAERGLHRGRVAVALRGGWARQAVVLSGWRSGGLAGGRSRSDSRKVGRFDGRIVHWSVGGGRSGAWALRRSGLAGGLALGRSNGRMVGRPDGRKVGRSGDPAGGRAGGRTVRRRSGGRTIGRSTVRRSVRQPAKSERR